MARARATSEGVNDHSNGQNGTSDHVAERGAEVQQGQTVRNCHNHNHTEQSRSGRTPATKEGGSTNHSRSDRIEVYVTCPRLLTSGCKTRSGKNTTQ